jgi:pimeloyl-ACP methyl ester carboxylesterase
MFKMPKVKVNDINMYYEIHGDGFPLVMINGLGGNADYWKIDPDFLGWISKNFKTIIFDNRGAGRTDKPDIEYSIKMFADDTVGLMDALHIEKSHILGNSMGGAIAQELVLNYPERVEKLVLGCTHCGGGRQIIPSPEVRETLMKLAGMTPEEGAETLISLLYTEDFIKNNLDVIERTRQYLLKDPMPEFSLQRQSVAAMYFNAGRRLKNVNTPTLIVQGKKDVLNPVQNTEKLAKLIPGSKTFLLDNAGHSFFYPNTERVKEGILKFLK